jgi:hypothetical protein
VIRRFAGEDGLVGPGISLYYPVPFSRLGALELTVQGTTGVNDVLYGFGRRPSINAQLAGFWQISRSTFAQASVSGLYGENPDTSLKTKLGVVAARFSWRPPQQAQAKELTLRGELWALKRSFDFIPPVTSGFDATRVGWYVDGTWKLNRRWTFSTRYDYVQSPEIGPLVHDWAVTPTITFWQSEFVYLRGLYEHTRLGPLANTPLNTQLNRDRLTLQVVFAMGPHKHELF